MHNSNVVHVKKIRKIWFMTNWIHIISNSPKANTKLVCISAGSTSFKGQKNFLCSTLLPQPPPSVILELILRISGCDGKGLEIAHLFSHSYIHIFIHSANTFSLIGSGLKSFLKRDGNINEWIKRQSFCPQGSQPAEGKVHKVKLVWKLWVVVKLINTKQEFRNSGPPWELWEECWGWGWHEGKGTCGEQWVHHTQFLALLPLLVFADSVIFSFCSPLPRRQSLEWV